MDCCNYGDYRPGPYGGASAWAACAPYGGPPPPIPYAPYAQRGYYAHEPYARYANRFEYPSYPIQHQREIALPMVAEYGGGSYASKESRSRRSGTRRDGRARTPVQHLPLPHTPPLECGFSGRSSSYYEQPMWHHYQMGAMNGGNGWSNSGMFHNTSAWSPRPMMACRDQMRYTNDYRIAKNYPQANHLFPPDGRSTPYSLYDDAHYNMESGCMPRAGTADSSSVSVPSPPELPEPPPREKPPEQQPKQVNTVPLPAFQQAFGSTEIGKFSEAFSRTELVLEEMSNASFPYDSYPEWETPSDNLWPSQNASKEIKCEETF